MRLRILAILALGLLALWGFLNHGASAVIRDAAGAGIVTKPPVFGPREGSRRFACGQHVSAG